MNSVQSSCKQPLPPSFHHWPPLSCTVRGSTEAQVHWKPRELGTDGLRWSVECSKHVLPSKLTTPPESHTSLSVGVPVVHTAAQGATYNQTSLCSVQYSTNLMLVTAALDCWKPWIQNNVAQLWKWPVKTLSGWTTRYLHRVLSGCYI